jgi:hypothetical protein
MALSCAQVSWRIAACGRGSLCALTGSGCACATLERENAEKRRCLRAAALPLAASASSTWRPAALIGSAHHLWWRLAAAYFQPSSEPISRTLRLGASALRSAYRLLGGAWIAPSAAVPLIALWLRHSGDNCGGSACARTRPSFGTLHHTTTSNPSSMPTAPD